MNNLKDSEIYAYIVRYIVHNKVRVLKEINSISKCLNIAINTGGRSGKEVQKDVLAQTKVWPLSTPD